VAKQQIKSGPGWKPKRMRAAFTARKGMGEHRKSMGQHREHKNNKDSRNSDLSLKAALLYAAKGLPVVPLHSKKMGGGCTCGNAACDKPGMHSGTKHGFRDATTNRVLIEKNWDEWPNAEIGIATGVDAGIIAVVASGEVGRSSLKELEARNTQRPKTVTIRAGKQRIYFFRIGSARLHCPTTRHGGGITILGDGVCVVAPCSIHYPELVRRFADGRAPGEVEIATAPPWLMDLIGEPTSAAQPAPSVILVRTSEILPERIEWLWEGFIAIGRLTGLVGYPGLGKSQVGLDLEATVSTGRDFPGGASNGKAGHVIILAAEDDPGDTIVPRLIAAGADRSRIHIVKAVKDSVGERPFNLSVDLDRLGVCPDYRDGQAKTRLAGRDLALSRPLPVR
jgi:hypothetical protein